MAYGRIVEQLEPEGTMLAIADMMRGGGCCSRGCQRLARDPVQKRWLARLPVRGDGGSPTPLWGSGSPACLCAAAAARSCRGSKEEDGDYF